MEEHWVRKDGGGEMGISSGAGTIKMDHPLVKAVSLLDQTQPDGLWKPNNASACSEQVASSMTRRVPRVSQVERGNHQPLLSMKADIS